MQYYCRSQLSSPSDAEDAAQETFIRFLQRPSGEIRDPEAWLITVARRACYAIACKRRLRSQEETTGPELIAKGALVEDAVLTSELVRSLFSCLGERDAKLLARLYIGGWSVDQVARDLDVTAGHVRVMALRARRRAQKALDAMGAGKSAVGLLPWLADPAQRLRARLGRVWARTAQTRDAAQARLAEATALPACVADSLACLAAIGVVSVAAGTSVTPPGGVGLDAAPARGTLALSTRSPQQSPQATSPAISATRFGGTASQPTSPGARTGLTDPGLLPSTVASRQNPQPQDVAFYSFTSSPAFTRDHTIFASGSQVIGCAAQCPVLFASHDEAASWQPVAAVGFGGGQILLPPTYPTDPVMFAVGAAGLQRSDDAGQTFITVIPGVLRAAIQPSAAPGNAQITVASAPLVVYSEASRSISRGPTLPAGVVKIDDLSYLGDGAHLVIAAERLDPSAPGQTDGVLTTCDASRCASGAVFAGKSPSVVRASPTESADGTIVASVGGKLWLSRDAGASYANRPLPSEAVVADLAFDPYFARTPTMIVDTLNTQSKSVLLQSVARDGNFAPVPLAGLGTSTLINAVSMLPNGDLLIAPQDADNLGVRCSSDDGRSWQMSCA